MKRFFKFWFYRLSVFLSVLLLGFYINVYAKTLTEPSTGFSITVQKKNGNYLLKTRKPNWQFKGSIGQKLSVVNSSKGVDGIGSFNQISFSWNDLSVPMKGDIRLYVKKPVVLFEVIYGDSIQKAGKPFPELTAFPKNLNMFSYRDHSFAPLEFNLQENSTPWLFFNNKDNCFIISPASNFMIARMIGDGKSLIASGFNQNLANLPKGFSHKTLLVVGHGINRTWDIWGHALTDLEGKKRPANDADIGLKYLGYWTDNGAFYYYNYDLNKGYEGTLLGLMSYYKKQQIPYHYLQLDSWWYPKTFTTHQGEKLQHPHSKNPKMAAGKWNRRGGMLEYVADPGVFPDGIAGFHKKLGLPLITHNRWIDPESPYHKKYKISGLGAVDPLWWNMIMKNIASWGVVTYEQDWLSAIYDDSPQMQTTTWAGKTFMDDMARACQESGLTMQYCMAQPRHFLQGSKYSNLTTIRVSLDGFGKKRWYPFLFASRLASALGIYPWVDVFRSTEVPNILLATLSAGMVGPGDEIGKENKANIFLSVRKDGVIVKPDVPIVPVDESFMECANHKDAPVVAETYTDFGSSKIRYVFAWNRSNKKRKLIVTPASLGIKKNVYIYNFFEGKGKYLRKGKAFAEKFEENIVTNSPSDYEGKDWGYYIISPVGQSGIAFLGDLGKFVSCGKERISSVVDNSNKLIASVIFARGEKSITLDGFSRSKPKVKVQNGKAGQLVYHKSSGLFRVNISPGANVKWIKSATGNERTAQVKVTFER